MANSTFSGPVRSEGGFEVIDKNSSTGAITTTLDIDASGNLNGISDFHNSGVNTVPLGLNPTWSLNFGKPDQGTIANVDDLLTNPNQALKLSMALEQVANQSAVLTAAQTGAIFGGTGVVGTDFAIAAGATEIAANQSVVRYTGNVGSTLALTASTTDLASDTHKSLIIFTDNVITASQALTLQVHTNNELDASSFEAFVTGAGTNVMEREATTTDGHAKIILTASAAATTIKAGSYIYFEAAADTDSMAVKMCIRTTGGTIAVTTANN
jgi:hypothetical protein